MSYNNFYLLIVDDNSGIQRVLYEALNFKGYKVEIAKNGIEAIRKVSEKIPSLILLDLKMPGMDGLQVIKELRKMIPNTPVVIMTAYSEFNRLLDAKNRGLIQHYISKPFDLNELFSLIKEILSQEIKLDNFKLA
jgi:two-component system response regulator (stage 0 sporulation protein F)